jgi:hypothetical protein
VQVDDPPLRIRAGKPLERYHTYEEYDNGRHHDYENSSYLRNGEHAGGRRNGRRDHDGGFADGFEETRYKGTDAGGEYHFESRAPGYHGVNRNFSRGHDGAYEAEPDRVQRVWAPGNSDTSGRGHDATYDDAGNFVPRGQYRHGRGGRNAPRLNSAGMDVQGSGGVLAGALDATSSTAGDVLEHVQDAPTHGRAMGRFGGGRGRDDSRLTGPSHAPGRGHDGNWDGNDERSTDPTAQRPAPQQYKYGGRPHRFDKQPPEPSTPADSADATKTEPAVSMPQPPRPAADPLDDFDLELPDSDDEYGRIAPGFEHTLPGFEHLAATKGRRRYLQRREGNGAAPASADSRAANIMVPVSQNPPEAAAPKKGKTPASPPPPRAPEASVDSQAVAAVQVDAAAVKVDLDPSVKFSPHAKDFNPDAAAATVHAASHLAEHVPQQKQDAAQVQAPPQVAVPWATARSTQPNAERLTAPHLAGASTNQTHPIHQQQLLQQPPGQQQQQQQYISAQYGYVVQNGQTYIQPLGSGQAVWPECSAGVHA